MSKSFHTSYSGALSENDQMKKTLVISCFALVLMAVSSCKKTEDISNTPSIKFISITPNPAIKYQDPVKITIEYTDGDGDLGSNTADAKNAFITDSRNNVTYEFRIPQQAPDNSPITIKGNLTFDLSPQGFVDDNNSSETATYSVYIVDRAGNKSNSVQSTALSINKQ
jgi:hypothetical protein